MNNITANNYYNFGPNNGVNQRPARVGHLNAVINALNQGGSGGVTWGSITGTLALQTDLQLALDNKVDKNALITGATKTKITYDAKGLVTAGADATTADIADSTNKRYVTDANLTVIGNTSGTNSGNQTLANTSDATSHTATLSSTGGSVKLVEGSGITLTTTGTSSDGIITIASTGGGSGTVTNVSALTLGTTGSDLSSTVANSTTTPVITLNVPTASAANRGALSSTDWSTFNGKQDALISGTNIKTINSTSILGSGNLVVAATPSGVSGAVQFSNGSAFSSDATNFFWDDTNDRLGIGTNTPSDRLTILGNSTSPIRASLRNTNANGDTQISLKNDTTGAAGFQVTGTTYFGNPSAYFFTQGALEKLSFTTDGDLAAGGNGFITFLTGGYNASQERMRILSTGNIGIGITAPTSKLVIKGTGTTSGTSSLNVTDSSDNSILFVRNDGKVGVGTTSPQSNIQITGGTLAGDSFTKNFLNVTGTFAATSSAGVQAGVYSAFTTAGSTSFQSIGNYTNLAAGYTGINSTVCLVGDNAAASAGTLLQLNLTATTPSGNTGVVGQARGTTIGNCIGTFGEGSNGLLNIGAMGKAITSKNSGVNIGMAAFALNQGTSPIQVGGYFGLQNASPNFSSAALICDNGLTTSDIFVARDNGTAIFNIIDNGNVGVGITAPTSKLHIKGSGATSATFSQHNVNSANADIFKVRDDGVVTVGPPGLAYAATTRFQVKDLSDNICFASTTSGIIINDNGTVSPNNGALYLSGVPVVLKTGNGNSGYLEFGDSVVNSVSLTGTKNLIQCTQAITSVAPSLNLSVNAFTTQNAINMTNGTGTKIFRGIYHNPTVTAVTSHRAFESSSGGGHFNTTSVDASSVLQADSTTQGFLPPRMTNAQRAAIVSPAEGLLVHNTTNKGTAYYDGTNWGYLNGAAQTIAGSGGTVNIPFASGNIVDLTLTASTTLTLSGHVVGVYILKVIQGGTGSYTLTYPASVKWSGGTPPTLTTTVGKTDIITLFHDGTNFFGTYSLNY